MRLTNRTARPKPALAGASPALKVLVALVALIGSGGAPLARASAAMPDAGSVLQAYEDARAEVTDPQQHPTELSFVGVRCNEPREGGVFVCQVDFVRTSAPQGRLYFEVITLRQNWFGRWKLLSGLCRGKGDGRPG